MRKHGLISLVLTFLLGVFGAQAQNYSMTAPEGYGAGTTGGAGGTTVTVTNATDLATQMAASGSKIILVSGTINVTSIIKKVVTNKSIIGLPGAKIVALGQSASVSGAMYLSGGSNNVIIRNLIFEGPGAYDTDGWDLLCADGCTKLWVDHCDFQDGCDGNFDNKGKTDNVTVSWCKFQYLKPPKAGGSGGTNDHRFTNLVGSSSTDKPSDGRFSITWQNCYWAQGCVERMTRARNAQLHFQNCYWNSSVAKCNLGLENANAYVENCNFTASSSVIYKSYGGTNNVKFAGCVGNIPSNVNSMSAPTYSYTSFPGANTASVVSGSCGAGATLQVSATGVISSPCSGTIITQPTIALSTGSASQTITLGAAITNIVYTLGGSATGATVTGLPAGVTATTSATSVTISGTPTATGTSSFTITTTQSSGTAVTTTGSIVVNAAPIAQPTIALNAGSASQTITIGSAITNVVYTLGGSATGATVTGLPAGVTASTSATSVTISGTPTATGTSSFTVTTTQASGTAVTKTGSIVVNAAPVAQPTIALTAGSASQTITIGAAITNVVHTLGGSATGATVTGLPAGVTATTSATSVTISGTPTATGASSFTVTTTQSSGTAVSASGSIVVNEVVITSGQTETFETLTSTVLATGSDKTQDVLINNLTWKVEKARLNTTASSAYAGNNSIRLMYTTGALVTPLLKGTQTVSFYVAGANASYAPTVSVYISTDGGATWSANPIASTTANATTFKQVSVSIAEATDNVKLKICNKGGASQSSSFNVFVDNVTFTAAPNARSAKAQDDFEESSASEGIKLVILGNDLSVIGQTPSKIAIVNINGTLVASAKGAASINIGSLAKGMYIALLIAEDGSVVSKKFIKE